jgi:hypothetical protein
MQAEEANIKENAAGLEDWILPVAKSCRTSPRDKLKRVR